VKSRAFPTSSLPRTLVWLAALGLALCPARRSPAQDQATPAPAATPAATPAPAAQTKPAIDMYDLDYDQETDQFLVVGTKQGYNGPVFSVYEGGKKESEGALKNGHEHGHWIEYFENGNKASEGDYFEGREEGPWKYWFENGNLQSDGSYKDGSPIGKWTNFFENGKVDSEGVFTDGLMDGAWIFYDAKTGEPTTIQFNNGLKVK
jgi:hypothetical protein